MCGVAGRRCGREFVLLSLFEHGSATFFDEFENESRHLEGVLREVVAVYRVLAVRRFVEVVTAVVVVLVAIPSALVVVRLPLSDLPVGHEEIAVPEYLELHDHPSNVVGVVVGREFDHGLVGFVSRSHGDIGHPSEAAPLVGNVSKNSVVDCSTTHHSLPTISTTLTKTLRLRETESLSSGPVVRSAVPEVEFVLECRNDVVHAVSNALPLPDFLGAFVYTAVAFLE